ncbi:hypothetical protein IEQ34_007853 [Dendrobium chrysotoxum]|uniref:Uncharacterized protein n=1 Tax=Dendrobium chrysotoxum TaxID=161865 RepID=A0AAV7FMY0_DENCH|nr:hypothetical protein IEQ34_026164 [Dendrobium chrysotoxum]KAH0437885.1 hypothetical protein IEQ34_026168 [Dendrobium chrysotoxum]KAH0437895.1 hypothetical protein IEQ34_026178 [Dendrobium chrysotoxum]KAH0437900.1 hypothetical protein IEQ34_026183 [Dendrobium chrysotoxum]KAH0438147.1 hypothetical protein IEQ34_026144 [Dendrobium chrysotoxum]
MIISRACTAQYHKHRIYPPHIVRSQRDDYPLLSPPCRGARGATVHIRAIASPSIDGWLDTERRNA